MLCARSHVCRHVHACRDNLGYWVNLSPPCCARSQAGQLHQKVPSFSCKEEPQLSLACLLQMPLPRYSSATWPPQTQRLILREKPVRTMITMWIMKLPGVITCSPTAIKSLP